MKKWLFIIAIILLCQYEGFSQLGIGFKTGFFSGSLTQSIDRPYNFATFNLPISYQINNWFGIESGIGYYRHGRVFKPPFISQYLPKGYVYAGVLRLPALAVFTPTKRDNRFIFSIKTGLGWGYYLHGKGKITTYDADLNPTVDSGSFSLDQQGFHRNELFTQYGFSFGFRVSDKVHIYSDILAILGVTSIGRNNQDESIKSWGGEVSLGVRYNFLKPKNN